jgi:hypothetical protein
MAKKPLVATHLCVGRTLRSTLCLLVLLLTAPFADAQSPLPTGNLVSNPNAQAGISGWSPEGQFSVRSLAMPGSPDSLSFWGGTSAVARGTQFISLSNWRDKIGQGCVTMTLSALLGGWQTQTDSATVRVDFLTSDFFTISSVTIGPVTNADRGNVTRMLPRSGTWTVPAGSENLRVVITSTRGSGTNNDGYADDISVVLNTTSTAPLPPDGFPIVLDSPAVAALGGTMTLSAVDPNLYGQCGLYYQWFQNGSPLLDEFGNGRTILGSKSASVTIGPLTPSDLLSDFFLVVMPVSVGANSSSPSAVWSRRLLVESECKDFATPTVTPSSAKALRGGNAVLRATTTVAPPSISGGPVTYQWSRTYFPPPEFGVASEPITIVLADGASDGGQIVSGANTPTLRLSNMQHFSDSTEYALGPTLDANFSTYELSWTTLCGTRTSAPVLVYEIDSTESGVGFVPESSSLGGFLNSGGSGGAVAGSIVRKTASGGGGTGGGFGYAVASITATITPTPFGSMLEIIRFGDVGGDGSGSVYMNLALDVDERTVWTIEPAGASPDVVVSFTQGAMTGVIRPSQPAFIQIRARPDLQGTFVWRMAMARDPRIVDVPLGPFNDSRWEISRVNAVGEEWYVPLTQAGNPPAIEVFGVQPSSTAGCGSQAFSLSAFTRRFQGLSDFSISGAATALNPPLAPAQGTTYLAMEALDASEDSPAAVASVRFADTSSTGPGTFTLQAGSNTASRTPAASPTQLYPFTLSRQGGVTQTASAPDTATDADTRPLRALRIVNGYLPQDCVGQPPGLFEGVRWGQAMFSGTRMCRADLNFDDVVDDTDFVLFATAYSVLACEAWEMTPGCGSDLNDDSTVDDTDFVLFAVAYSDLLCP